MNVAASHIRELVHRITEAWAHPLPHRVLTVLDVLEPRGARG